MEFRFQYCYPLPSNIPNPPIKFPVHISPTELHRTPDPTTMKHLQDLPEHVLTKIIGYSKYQRIVTLRTVSRRFNKVCSDILNTAFLNLEPRLKSKLISIQLQIKQTQSSKELTKLLFHYRILQILEGEVRALHTVCGRYVDKGVSCFTGGALLDCFYGITALEAHQLKENVERSVAVQLYLLCEEFADHFEEHVEPKLPVSLVTVGSKIVDLLDTFLDSNYQLLSTSGGDDDVHLVGCYEVFSASEGISAPPKPSSGIASPADITRLIRYLRNTVRWHNLCHCLDTCRKKPRGTKASSHHRHLCLDVPGIVQDDIGRDGDQGVRRMYRRNNCRGEANGYKQGLAISLDLHCRASQIPRKLRSKVATTTRTEVPDTVTLLQDTAPESADGKYEFSMEMRVRYCVVENIEEVTKEAVFQFHHSNEGCLLVQNTHRIESFGSDSSLG